MQGTTKRHGLLGIILIVTILVAIPGGLIAQSPFYSPFYYPGSYFVPAPYPYYPVFTPVYSAYNPVPVLPLYNPLYGQPAPISPTALSAPTLSSAPTASIAAAIPLVPITPISTITAVIIADIAINTGNPEVAAVLNLIIQDPTLADNPFLLDAIINTGNPDVASALAWLVSII